MEFFYHDANLFKFLGDDSNVSENLRPVRYM